MLHSIGSDAAHVPVTVKNALAGKHGEHEVELTNSPFGKKSSITIVNETGGGEKQSLVVTNARNEGTKIVTGSRYLADIAVDGGLLPCRLLRKEEQ